MSDKLFTPEQIVSILSETPGRLAAAARNATPEALRAAPGPGEWSPVEVLAHLRACADVWNRAIERILDEDVPTIRAVSPRTYIADTDYPTLEFAPSLEAFTRQREGLLARLAEVPAEGWQRRAVVTGAGRPYERTLRDYGERMARHEREHARQVERLAGKMGGGRGKRKRKDQRKGRKGFAKDAKGI